MVIFGLSNVFSRLSPNIKASIIITVILIILAVIIGFKAKKQDPNKPSKGILMLFEMLVEWINNMCKDTLGDRWKKYAPMILTMAMFIFVSNVSGMFGFSNPTSNIAITVALGCISAFMIHWTAIKTNGIKKYLKSYLDPSPVMLPINIVSEIVTPFSLGMRLFGNIISGGIIMLLIYKSLAIIQIAGVPLGAILSVFVAPLFHAIFDIFFGAIQTYVFILLTLTFIAGKLPEEE